MNMRTPLGWLAVVLGGLAATGCIASPDEDVGGLEEPALHGNALTQNALTQNALTQNALTQNALTQNALEDPEARELFSYIVSCALPEGAELQYTDGEGTSHVFHGDLGLAPHWGNPGGKCDAACQQWVSGCVLSRLSYDGEPHVISVRGTHPALMVTGAEHHAFKRREATYYGNIFSQPQRLLACLPPGRKQDPRVCGPSIEDCALSFQGSCADVCLGSLHNGAFFLCVGPSDHVGGMPKKLYLGDVTVFLP